MSANSKPRPVLAAYAADWTKSQGRLHAEPESATRTPFQRDRDRIIHAAAFRRLKHKTQVFVFHEGDHFRTRLTHSLEVAQIARSLARTLGLDEDLAETLALSHDLGHTCFGHAGEEALDACMAPFGGFDHNGQALKIVTQLEQRYPRFDGLNLTWETLEGLVKHNGPLTGPHATRKAGEFILAYNKRHDLALDRFASVEAQVAAISDDIAYNNHDIDDGLRAGLFNIDDLMALPLVGDLFRSAFDRFPGVDADRVVQEAIRDLIGLMVGDVVAEVGKRIQSAGITSAADVRNHNAALAGFSGALARDTGVLRQFLFDRMYRHHRVWRMAVKAKRIVADLFGAFLDDPRLLPEEWRGQCGKPGEEGTAKAVADYIAGMTDRYALVEHRRLFGLDLWPQAE